MSRPIEKAVNILSNELKCPLCRETFKTPYSLPCLHSFCKNCITAELKNTSKCPSCKIAIFKRSARPNEQLENLIRAYDSLLSSTNGLKDNTGASNPSPSKSRAKPRSRRILDEDDDEDDRLEATNPKRAKHDEPPNVEEDNEMEVENLVGENELDLLRAESVGGEIRVLQKELDIVAFHIKDISTLLGHPVPGYRSASHSLGDSLPSPEAGQHLELSEAIFQSTQKSGNMTQGRSPSDGYVVIPSSHPTQSRGNGAPLVNSTGVIEIPDDSQPALVLTDRGLTSPHQPLVLEHDEEDDIFSNLNPPLSSTSRSKTDILEPLANEPATKRGTNRNGSTVPIIVDISTQGTISNIKPQAPITVTGSRSSLSRLNTKSIQVTNSEWDEPAQDRNTNSEGADANCDQPEDVDNDFMPRKNTSMSSVSAAQQLQQIIPRTPSSSANAAPIMTQSATHKEPERRGRAKSTASKTRQQSSHDVEDELTPTLKPTPRSRAASMSRSRANGTASRPSSQQLPQQNGISICCTSLQPTQTRKLERLAAAIGASVTDQVTEDVTHLVTDSNAQLQCNRTLKYLHAILRHKWVVTFKWLEASGKRNSRVNEEEYEIQGDTVGNMNGPNRSRRAAKKQLLTDYSIFLYGEFKAPPKKDIKSCVEMTGATVLTRIPREQDCLRDPMIIVLYDPESYKQDAKLQRLTLVSVQWLLDSISRFEVAALEEYRHR